MSDLGWGVLATLGVLVIVLVVITCVVVLTLMIKLVRKHRELKLPGVPTSAKVTYYVSILYTLLPVDLLPDPILIDDIGVLIGALTYVGTAIKKVQADLAFQYGGHALPARSTD